MISGGRRRVALRWIECALGVSGVALLAAWGWNDAERHAFQAAASARLDRSVRAQSATPAATVPTARRVRTAQRGHVRRPAVTTPSAPPSTAVRATLGRIEIPRLGISAMVVEGTGPAELALAIGHLPHSALPGAGGNCALAGHRDSFLRGLQRVRVGDVIRVVTVHARYDYRVEWARVVEPERTDVLGRTATPSLTLVTCYPFHLVGPAPDRFVVRARQTQEAAAGQRAAAAGRPGGTGRPRPTV